MATKTQTVTVTGTDGKDYEVTLTAEGSITVNSVTPLDNGNVVPPEPPDGGGGDLPTDVTLQAIDGGPSYYADNGFTHAATAGWDKPSFFPISIFLEKCINQDHANKWKDIKANLMVSGQASDTTLKVLRDNGIYLFAQAVELDKILANNNNGALGSETVGINAYDEPGTYAQCIGALQSVANTHQDQRLFYENFTWNQLAYGDVERHMMDDLYNDMIATPNGSKRHLDLASVDIYWMAGDNGPDGGAYNSGLLYQRDMLSRDERRRGARYGDMIDWIARGNPICQHPKWQSDYPAPVAVFVETGGPYTENNTVASYSQPPEINAAVWSTLIHGARHVQYFSHTFGSAGGGGTLLFNDFYKQPYPGQSISVYDQVKATNTQIASLATVLNSPFAIGFVTVSPEGWKFGDPALSAFKGDGFDVMAKLHNVAGGDNAFYVFCMPRYSPALQDQTATFTVKSGTTATVVGENRSIPISGGRFTDKFKDGHTVHIYKIG